MEDFLEILGPFRLVVIVAVTTYIIATAVFNIWYFYIVYSGKDPKCKAPLPPGEMGWPVIGESFKVLMQVNDTKTPHVIDCIGREVRDRHTLQLDNHIG